MANCMLLDAKLAKCYWGEAILTANYVQNRMPSRSVDRTPYELWTGTAPDLAHMKIFGCEAYVHVPDAKRKKFDAKARKLVFIGYSSQHKGYRFLDRGSNRVVISRDAKFLELGNGSEQQEENSEDPVVPVQQPGEEEEVEVTIRSDNDKGVVREEEEEEIDEQSVESDSNDSDESDFYGFEDNPEGNSEELTRANRRNRGVLPKRYEDFLVGQVTLDEEPSDFREAMVIPEWKCAMIEEMKAHADNKTWELVRLPAGKKLISVKWVYKLKRDDTGSVVKHKARIVAQGYSQSPGVDYTEVFAPVSRQTTLRVLLAIAGQKQLELRQFDVKTAYLNGTIEEELYMSQPPGFIEKEKEGFVCRLRKSIYGLHQSARCWHKVLHAALLELKFEPCDADACLYVRRGQCVVYVLVYVDDLIIASTNVEEIGKVFQSLRKKFGMTALGAVRHFLGYEIAKEGGYYTLRLTPYIESLIRKFNMQDSKPVKTPMDTGYTLDNPDSKKFDDPSLFRSLIGGLLYVAINARPDLSLCVGLLGRKVSQPNTMDWSAAKRVLQYLNTTKGWKLRYGSKDNWKLVGYTDSDWAGDRQTRRSTTGFVFFYGTGPVSWISKAQGSVALSSLEAEYNALTLACQELIWLRRLLNELGHPQGEPTTLFEDNQGCLSFAKAERASNRVKHIDTKRHFVRELCEQNIVKLVYCPTNEMAADALTKPVGPTIMQQFVKKIGLQS